MELPSLIDKLEEAINSGMGLPATGRLLVERGKLRELVDQIRQAMAPDIQEAQELLRMRERVINQALTEARHIKSAAEEEAKARVQESEITKETRKKAEEVIAEAQRRAQRMLDEADAQASARRAGADDYTRVALHKLEEELLQVLNTVRRGMEVLDTGKEPSA